MPSNFQHLVDLQRGLDPALGRGPCVLVSVQRVRGSGPREEGAWMAVWPDAIVGTLGGGRLEHEAIALARAPVPGDAGGGHRRADHHGVALDGQGFDKTFALGPSLGQCCGGAVDLRFEPLAPGPLGHALRSRLLRPAMPVALFGGGHVGQALVHVLGTLPMRVLWVDSRDQIFPPAVPANVQCEHSQPVQGAVAQLEAGSCVLIMSFSHAEDLDVVQACLKRRRERDDLPFVGLIGSATKWATFARRLRDRGFAQAEIDRVACPIGLPSLGGKEPEVIAVSVAAQLLQMRPSGTAAP